MPTGFKRKFCFSAYELITRFSVSLRHLKNKFPFNFKLTSEGEATTLVGTFLQSLKLAAPLESEFSGLQVLYQWSSLDSFLFDPIGKVDT